MTWFPVEIHETEELRHIVQSQGPQIGPAVRVEN